MDTRPTPEQLWQPTEETVAKSNLTQFIQWLSAEYDLDFRAYDELWKWSVTHIDEFWAAIWEYFEIMSDEPYRKVREGDSMPGVRWFEGAGISYSEHVFRNFSEERPAIIYGGENSDIREMSWSELSTKVSAFRAYLSDCGVAEGDAAIIGYVGGDFLTTFTISVRQHQVSTVL